MINKVYMILRKFNFPTAYIVRPNFGSSTAVLSYHFFNNRYSHYGDGEGKDFIGSLQIDIFYKRDLKDLPKEIIKELEKINFRFSYEDEFEDTLSGTRLYHKVLVFNYLESEVI